MIRAVPWRTPMYHDDGVMDSVWVKFFQEPVGGGSTTGGGTPGVSGGTVTLTIVAGTATPNPALGSIQKIIIDQAVTIAAPLGTPVNGDRLTFYLIQHATAGGFQPVWDPIYVLGDYSVISIDKGTFSVIDLFWDTANWYIAGFPVMGQI